MTLDAKCTWRSGFNADLAGLRALSFAFLTGGKSGVLFGFLLFVALAGAVSRSNEDPVEFTPTPVSNSVPESETLVGRQDKRWDDQQGRGCSK